MTRKEYRIRTAVGVVGIVTTMGFVFYIVYHAGLPSVHGKLAISRPDSTVSEYRATQCVSYDADRETSIYFSESSSTLPVVEDLYLRASELPDNPATWWKRTQPSLTVYRNSFTEERDPLNCRVEENAVRIEWLWGRARALHHWEGAYRATCEDTNGDVLNIDLTFQNCQ